MRSRETKQRIMVLLWKRKLKTRISRTISRRDIFISKCEVYITRQYNMAINFAKNFTLPSYLHVINRRRALFNLLLLKRYVQRSGDAAIVFASDQWLSFTTREFLSIKKNRNVMDARELTASSVCYTHSREDSARREFYLYAVRHIYVEELLFPFPARKDSFSAATARGLPPPSRSSTAD